MCWSGEWVREDDTPGIFRVWPKCEGLVVSPHLRLLFKTPDHWNILFFIGTLTRWQTQSCFHQNLFPSCPGHPARRLLEAPVGCGCAIRPDWSSVGGSGVGRFQARRGSFPHRAPRAGSSLQDGEHARGDPSGLLNDCAEACYCPPRPWGFV